MSRDWETTVLGTEGEVLKVLAELQGKQWLCRGQPECYGGLVPSIDRESRSGPTRHEKLALERRAINIFRSTARFFHHKGERRALDDDITALMVLRHYGVPTRLLDWTMSPYVAAYFAVSESNGKDGEIWSFDRQLYESKGAEQWVKWPETTSDGSGAGSKFDAKLTAFDPDFQHNWLISVFYRGFPRHDAQSSAYTMTAQFSINHERTIADLLEDPSACHRYVVKQERKKRLQDRLREEHGICRRSLFPDSAGAAETVIKEVFSEGQSSSVV